ncbi:MAG TPA: alpha/beta fold hydrolase, partial [Thermoanaerobaculia bacterium]|nr:alpha/beta fold hydrolase [Thermoanaerobaculia bacterium]
MRYTPRVRRWTLLAPLSLLLTSCASLRPFEEVRRQVPAEEFVEVDGGLVHVEQAGSGDAADAVVLLHGFGASSYGWRKVMPGLAESYRVVAPDFYGF